MDDVEISIDKWQNEYLWLVEQTSDINFRDITFYADDNGSKFMVAISLKSFDSIAIGVMITRFKIAQLDRASPIEYSTLPSSATDNDMM